MSNHQTPPPGHGPSPQGDQHGQGATATAPPPPEPRKKNFFARHKILSAFLAVLLVGSCMAAVGGGDEEGADAAAPAATETSSEPVTSDEEDTGSSDSSQGSTADEPVVEDEVLDEDGQEAEAAEEDDPTAEEEPVQEEPGLPGIGDSVSVDDFEITVTGVETGITYVGPADWGEEPQGQFVKVLVTVKNNGTSAEMFFDSEQKLIDEQDREHSTSSAGIYLDEASLWLTDINPGNTATGALLYDIPTDAQPTRLKVSSGLFGKTAEVDLG